MPRQLFSDGVNSLAHFSFGIISYLYPIVVPTFLLYQVATPDENTGVDIVEYGLGLLSTVILNVNK